MTQLETVVIRNRASRSEVDFEAIIQHTRLRAVVVIIALRIGPTDRSAIRPDYQIRQRQTEPTRLALAARDNCNSKK